MIDIDTVPFAHVPVKDTVIINNKLCLKIDQYTVVDQGGDFLFPEINEPVVPVEV